MKGIGPKISLCIWRCKVINGGNPKWGKKVLVVDIYAPNENKELFYEEIQKEIVRREYEEYCILGDFDAIFDS